MADLIRVDLHLHSEHSFDSRTTLSEIVDRCREAGLDRIALTDHNTVQGALELARLFPELAIVGEEVKTTEGEVIGLFLPAEVGAGLSPEQTMDRIHEMGGLTYLPHPLDRRRYHFTPDRLVELAPRVDIIETYNTWCEADANQAAAELAAELGKVAASGSDAHAAGELGHSWQEMEAFGGPADFLAKLKVARAHRTPESGARRRA